MLDQRIDERAILLQTVIEVWTGGQTSRTHPADERSLLALRPRADAARKRREVQVVTLKPAGVAQVHHVATATAPSGGNDRARRDGNHRCAEWRGVVDPEMLAVGSKDRMQPTVREPGGDAWL